MFFIAAVIIVLIAVPLSMAASDAILRRAIRRAYEQGRLDHPTERGSHTLSTPRAGGQAIAPLVIAAAILILVARLFYGGAVSHAVSCYFAAGWWALILGGAVAAGVGYWDDAFGLSVKPKMIGQFAAAGFAALLAGRFGTACLWGVHITLPTILMVMAAFAWVWYLMNAVNFMDGMDGLVSVFSFFCLAAFALMVGVAPNSSNAGEILLALAVFAGAMIAFHRRNVTSTQADKTFMGDCGSQFTGLALGVFSLLLTRTNEGKTVDFTVPVILFYPFLFDTLLAIARRALRGENIFEAHHQHLYQRELELGDTHAQVRERWIKIFMIHFFLAAIVIWFGSGSCAGRLALLAAIIPMLVYHRHVAEREWNKNLEKLKDATP
ncbi:MAG: hypothetical protein NTX50_15665 [Candidatus Sumerlaeota bacterium]|nr:hypothetical protein [Candidatus Sumerlaeota bacterium]